jgi:putative copper export protein
VLLWVGVGGSAMSFLLDVLDAQGLELLDLLVPATWLPVMSFPFTLSAAVLFVAFASAIWATRAEGAKFRAILALAALLVAAAVFGVSGHASLMKPQWLGRGLAFGHGLVVIFWLGALPPLAARLAIERAGGAVADFKRFSQIALAAVGVLVVSGSVMALSHVRSVGNLSDTPYGQIMSAKLILWCGMIGLATTNRIWLTPGLGTQDGHLRRYLRWSIHLEIALGVTILFAVSLWRFLGPPPPERAPIILNLSQEALAVSARLLPRSPHSTTLTLVVEMRAQNKPRDVLVTISNPTAGVAGLERDARARETGTWVVDELILPVKGTWHIDVAVLVSDFERRHARGTFEW